MAALAPHTISQPRARRKAKRVGRGIASGKGKTSARGEKGQKARSGGKAGLKTFGFKQSLQKVPKLRGFKSQKPKKETVTLAKLAEYSEANQVVTPHVLKEKGVIARPQSGVKIVASGTMPHAITVEGCLVSKKAVELIEKAGGKIVF